ncbi:hypothetical protein [Nocardia jiangsuensis]|uniref:Serine/threonine-protein kinase RsbW n=1 Tax=Nocardia jiangsuensis TaxID=1691563 RepID=A0ABV8DPP6_9NOCA
MPDSTVAMEFDARPEQLGMVRALTRVLALQLELALDEAADLELAVHEVGTALVAIAAPGAVVRCEYRSRATTIGVLVSSTTVIAPRTTGLGWHIVRTLASNLTVDCVPDDPQHTVIVGFNWARPLGWNHL